MRAGDGLADDESLDDAIRAVEGAARGFATALQDIRAHVVGERIGTQFRTLVFFI